MIFQDSCFFRKCLYWLFMSSVLLQITFSDNVTIQVMPRIQWANIIGWLNPFSLSNWLFASNEFNKVLKAIILWQAFSSRVTETCTCDRISCTRSNAIIISSIIDTDIKQNLPNFRWGLSTLIKHLIWEHWTLKVRSLVFKVFGSFLIVIEIDVLLRGTW